MRTARVRLGELLLALDNTLVTLVNAPRGLDLPVGSAALIDSDDLRLGLAVGAGNADLFFLVGVPAEAAAHWLDGKPRAPIAIFVKEPTDALVSRAAAAGAAVVAVDPRARWERLYKLVTHFFEHRGDRDDPRLASGTDLFGLAQSIADRTRGMVSIEDAESHVLAYSASNDEADELRRLSILGRAGPPEHLEWLSQWGIFDALRASSDVVAVAERPELGLRPRLAIGIHLPPTSTSRGDRGPSVFGGTIWLQQGSAPLAEDADEVLRGAAVLATRIMSRLATAPSAHTVRVQELLGLEGISDGDDAADATAIARELGIATDGRAALIGFAGIGEAPLPADVIALSASAFHADAQVTATGKRVYVLLPQHGARAPVTSWVRGMVAALRRELGLTLRAVIGAPLPGIGAAAAARVEVDRVFESAERHPGVIPPIASLDDARTTVLLDEIVSQVAGQPRLVDPRVHALRDYDAAHDGSLVQTLGVYLDCFGDIAAAAADLHVHPNTVRYRVRRIEKVLGSSLGDADDRLVLALGLRATAS